MTDLSMGVYGHACEDIENTCADRPSCRELVAVMDVNATGVIESEAV